ncbi:LysE family translocator [Ensifer soli]|uniref:LysE family translocator n=1 Tax=Ciceribacter sp. sgz301302 TaxID=3342379 RepID=UPI0035B9ED3D
MLTDLMLTRATLLAFTLASLLIELTPGPNMTYLALVGVKAGRRAGFAAVAGVALGLALLALVVSLGIGRAIEAGSAPYEALRWAGVAYLLYLAFDAWREPAMPAAVTVEAARRYFLRGLVTNLLNPKAALFYVTVLPTFLAPTGGTPSQALTLSAIYVAVATGIHATIVALASLLSPLLSDRRRLRHGGRLFAVALAGVALWIAWSTG